MSSLRKAREYLRVSQDRSGRARSLTEQHDDHIEAGREHGFTLNGEAYSDESISASRYTSKIRGGFGRLMADLAGGTFGAGLLVIWEGSRGSRRVREWLDLIEACERAGVLIFIFTHDRIYNPANGRDRKTLIEDAADSEFESSKTSRRSGRAAAATAAAGRPHGRTPYGYRRVYDPETRRLAAQEPVPAEAAIVRELFERLRAGHSLKCIARDYSARGIKTRTGKPWTAEHLRDVALRPAYGGLRVHEAPHGLHHGRKSLEFAVAAVWPAIVDPETFYAVRARLADPARKVSRPGRGKHLLSHIAVCGVCGAALAVGYRPADRRLYQCRDRTCVRIPADALDEYAEAALFAYLAREDVITQLRAASGDDAGLARVRGELAAARGELADWQARARRREVTAGSFAAIEPGIVGQITELETAERELTTPAAVAWLIEPGEDVRARWASAPVSARREVAKMLFSPAMLGRLQVMRSPAPGHTVPAADRVAWWRETVR